jgi:hypothetical protein
MRAAQRRPAAERGPGVADGGRRPRRSRAGGWAARGAAGAGAGGPGLHRPGARAGHPGPGDGGVPGHGGVAAAQLAGFAGAPSLRSMLGPCAPGLLPTPPTRAPSPTPASRRCLAPQAAPLASALTWQATLFRQDVQASRGRSKLRQGPGLLHGSVVICTCRWRLASACPPKARSPAPSAG